MIRFALLVACALAFSVAGCKPKPPTSPHCVSNTELQYKRIDDGYAKYKAGEKPSGGVYWARYYLETARFVLTGKGINGSGAACTGPDRDSADYDRLMSGLRDRERNVEEMEQLRGVRFAGIAGAENGGGLRWVDRNTNAPISGNDANTL